MADLFRDHSYMGDSTYHHLVVSGSHANPVAADGPPVQLGDASSQPDESIRVSPLVCRGSIAGGAPPSHFHVRPVMGASGVIRQIRSPCRYAWAWDGRV